MNSHIDELKPASKQDTRWDFSERLRTWLLVLVPLNLMTLISELSDWFIGLAAIAIIWQWAIVKQVLNKPRTWLKLILVVAGCLLLILTGKSMGLLIGMLHLLCLSYLLKPLEVSQRKDFYLLVIIGLLIVVISLIFNHSIYFMIAVLCLLVANIAMLFSLFKVNVSIKGAMFFSTKLIIQSLPLAIVLFIVFPKIPPFWQVPQAEGAKTGLSDTLKIGDISKLALSNELAFRVTFNKIISTTEALYWRGIVLEDFDGKAWSSHFRKNEEISRYLRVPNNRISLVNTAASVIDYEVIMEPSNQSWLFGLDVAQFTQGNMGSQFIALNDYRLYSTRKIRHPVSYQVTSNLSQPLNGYFSRQTAARNLALNSRNNPKLLAYGQKLNRDFNTPREMINRVLTHFRQADYRYTLEPPILSNNSIDEFFFGTKAGFCEHYASSFTYIMRAAGIPSRVVLGYLGGELNEQGNYYRVFQRDAHAWSEVWLNGEGWVRIDPTAAVDPSRVEQGFSSQLNQQQEKQFNFDKWFSDEWVGTVQLYMDFIDYKWTKLVINYSNENQFDLLKRWFGEDVPLKSALFILLFAGAVVAVYFLYVHWNKLRASRKAVEIYYYQRSLVLIEQFGVTRKNNETDIQYLQRVSSKDKHVAHKMAAVINQYNQVIYGNSQIRVNKQVIKRLYGELKRTIKQQ